MDNSPTIQGTEKTWNLEKELCSLTRSSNICEALHLLGLLSKHTTGLHLNAEPWIRGSAETYHSKFEFPSPERSASIVLIKACVTFTPGAVLDSVLGEWLRRRDLLSEKDIRTRHLYGADSDLGASGIRHDREPKIYRMPYEYIFYTDLGLNPREYDRLRGLFAIQDG